MKKYESVVRLLHKTHQEFRPTIFFVSHELETVKRLCNRILVMEKGQLIGEFLNNPQQYEEEPLSYLEKVERFASMTFQKPLPNIGHLCWLV